MGAVTGCAGHRPRGRPTASSCTPGPEVAVASTKRSPMTCQLRAARAAARPVRTCSGGQRLAHVGAGVTFVSWYRRASTPERRSPRALTASPRRSHFSSSAGPRLAGGQGRRAEAQMISTWHAEPTRRARSSTGRSPAHPPENAQRCDQSVRLTLIAKKHLDDRAIKARGGPGLALTARTSPRAQPTRRSGCRAPSRSSEAEFRSVRAGRSSPTTPPREAGPRHRPAPHPGSPKSVNGGKNAAQ